MTDASAEARELMAQARALPEPSSQRVDLLELAARYAESAGDLELAYEAHDAAIDAGIQAGEAQRALMAFAWCLAQCDELPERFPERALHWRFKWILEWVPEFAEVNRSQIHGLLADMQTRFDKRGEGKNALAKLHAHAADFLGDDALLERHLADWKKAPRDSLSDCRACDLDEEVRLLVRLDQHEAAVRAARAMISRGASCAEVPALTYARSLPSLLRQGDAATAELWHRRGYPMLKRMRKKRIGHVGEHLTHCAVVGDTGRGMRILRESLPLAAAHPAAFSQLNFLTGAFLVLERVSRDTARVTLTLPEAFGGSGTSKKEEPALLAQALLERARQIAARFDRRNENDRFSRRLEDAIALRELSLTLPKTE